MKEGTAKGTAACKLVQLYVISLFRVTQAQRNLLYTAQYHAITTDQTNVEQQYVLRDSQRTANTSQYRAGNSTMVLTLYLYAFTTYPSLHRTCATS